MQIQNLQSSSRICFADFSLEMCKVVASYYLMTAVNGNDTYLNDLGRRANDTFEHWVSCMLIFNAS